MKRRLVAARVDSHGDANSTDKRGCQIHPLGEEPSVQTLTPRSLARNVAELDALRSRVLALELQLSQNEVDTALLSAQQKSVAKKLPPLAGGGTGGPGADSTGSGDEANLTTSTSLTTRIATAPEYSTRRTFALTLPAPPASQLKPSNTTNPTLETLETGSVFTVEQLQPNSQHSQSAHTLPSQLIRAKDSPTPAASSIEEQAENSPAESQAPRTSSNITGKRLSISHSLTGLAQVTASPSQGDESKITLGHDGGDAVFAISKRNRLYQILMQVSTLVPIKEDELVMLKKLVDAEIGDVIKFLMDLEHEKSPAVISEKLSHLLETGSPSKYHTTRAELLPRQHPVWGIQYPLQKIARNLERLCSLPSSDAPAAAPSSSPSKRMKVIVLVSSGAYNPIHMLHVRALYVARQYVESNYKFPVVGAFISPSHDTYVRVKNRVNPREMITKRHRLALIEAAVASSTWIEVDKWEITRRRVLDYLSTLTHVREMCSSHFPAFKFHLIYVCGCNTVVKLSHSALRDEGFGCITVCRPTQTEMVIKHLGKQLVRSTTIVEDTGVLPCDLERATSFRVRKALAHIDKNSAAIELMVGKPVFQYLTKHDIGAKIAGKEGWTDEDKQWRDVDLPYVEYVES